MVGAGSPQCLCREENAGSSSSCSVLGLRASRAHWSAGLPFDDTVWSWAARARGTLKGERLVGGRRLRAGLLLPSPPPLRHGAARGVMLKTLEWDASIYRIPGWKCLLEILTGLFLTRQDCTQGPAHCQVRMATQRESPFSPSLGAPSCHPGVAVAGPPLVELHVYK